MSYVFGGLGYLNDHVDARLAVTAEPVATVLCREIYISFFRMAEENPILDPRVKLSWEVFALALLEYYASSICNSLSINKFVLT